MSQTLSRTYIPELGTVRRGKVRDIYEAGDKLIMLASDRISCFDRILPQQIPNKGRVLNEISNYWFSQTEDIVSNHLIGNPDPNVVIARKCKALPVEVIVRGFLCGSLWREYEKGTRSIYGLTLPEGLQENQAFPEPIITPTTKAEHGHDEPITADEIIAQGLVDKELWAEIERVALALFARGQQLAQSKGLVLVDTKYEFGLNTEGDLVLIDEIHTPDSSRYWFQSEASRKQMRFPDKEFVRQWLRKQGFEGEGDIPSLPQDVIDAAGGGYQDILNTMVGAELNEHADNVHKRVIENLRKEGLIKGYYAVIMAGSRTDEAHVQKICDGLSAEGIPHQAIYASAHKQPATVAELMELFNQSLEPVVCIAVAGMSNALGGVLAANVRWPVINCPPFKDLTDYSINIHSSLQMPRNVPGMTVIHPGNAAQATARILKAHW
jgi:phosphoribosylaminoimidazole-succinocarboxamide synthase